jgi:hypothetical protein
MVVVERLLRLRRLKRRLESIVGITESNEDIPKDLLDESECLQWAIDNIVTTNFSQVVLIVGHPLSFDNIEVQNFKIDNNIAAAVEFNPSKFEISLLRKYFKPENATGRKIPLELPDYMIGEEYYATRDKLNQDQVAFYVEGLVHNEHLTEFGKHGVRAKLRKWLIDLYNAVTTSK